MLVHRFTNPGSFNQCPLHSGKSHQQHLKYVDDSTPLHNSLPTFLIHLEPYIPPQSLVERLTHRPQWTLAQPRTVCDEDQGPKSHCFHRRWPPPALGHLATIATLLSRIQYVHILSTLARNDLSDLRPCRLTRAMPHP